MRFYRYSRWDGTQQLDAFTPEDVMEQIADELLSQSVAIARRTVAKYRDELRILPARLRHS